APAALDAQEPEGVRLGLLYQPEYQPGLVVLPLAAEGMAASVAAPIHRLLVQDFDYSDRFEVLQAGAAGVEDTVNLALWKERGADWVLQGVLEPGVAGG